METYSKEKQIKDEESAVASALPMTSQMFVLTEDGLESVEKYLDDDTTQHKQHQDTGKYAQKIHILQGVVKSNHQS